MEDRQPIKCEACGIEFTPSWSREEAVEECIQNFGKHEESWAEICDDCYKKIMLEIFN